MLEFLNGKKTYIAGALIGIASTLNYLGYPEIASLVLHFGEALGIIGLGHKIAKAK